MNQFVQRRCLVTSAVAHLGLLGALALLSAFAPKDPPVSTQPYILLVPTAENLTADHSSGGSPPTAPVRVTPARSVDAPRPTVRPAVRRDPTPVPRSPTPPVAVTPPTPVRRKPTPQEVDESRPAPPKKTIEVSAVKVQTLQEDRKAREREEQAEEAARELAAKEKAARDAARRDRDQRNRREWERRERERREALTGVIEGLGASLAPGTKIEIPGPGGGGAVMVNYADYVQSVFQAAWNRNRPPTLAAKSARSRVSLTIRRDGSFSYRVLTTARIADVDAAIARILSNQRRLNPLPAELKDNSMEIIITFNLESSASG